MTGPAGSVIPAGKYPLCLTRIINGYSGKIMSRNNFDAFFIMHKFKEKNPTIMTCKEKWQLEHCH